MCLGRFCGIGMICFQMLLLPTIVSCTSKPIADFVSLIHRLRHFSTIYVFCNIFLTYSILTFKCFYEYIIPLAYKWYLIIIMYLVASLDRLSHYTTPDTYIINYIVFLFHLFLYFHGRHFFNKLLFCPIFLQSS